jgi:glycosyltransferase involved in cell wall biosynthesis
MSQPRKLRIGFVSTRFDSTDGVSLETAKWAHVLEELGHECFYFAGLCDRSAECSYILPEAHFKHPEILSIYVPSFSMRIRPPEVTKKISTIKHFLKKHLRSFVKKFDIDLLLVENALAIPLNIPLGVAITEFIAESGLPTIAHHHDFIWERDRFLVNCIGDYADMAFPPRLPSIQHVVINSVAARQFSLRTGLVASLIPNVMDFETPPPFPGSYTTLLREDLRIAPDEYFFLQPTRVVQRKGIDRSIELVRLLDLKARLIISSASRDEGGEYEAYVRKLAHFLDVKINFVSDIIQDRRGMTDDGRKIYSLWDVYHHADLVTYPSQMEGFGNAFLEAVYFRRPIVVNTYTIYAVDIKPKGFEAVEFDGFITEKTVEHVKTLITNPARVEKMTQHNFELAKRYYSFRTLKYHLQSLLHTFFGSE